MPYEILDHTADAVVRGIGATLEESFTEAARGMFSLMADLEQVQPGKRVEIEIQADSIEGLLVAWLGELLTQRDLTGLLFAQFAVRIDGGDGGFRLRGQAWGKRIDPSRHRLGVEMKAAPYSGVRVEHAGGRYVTQCLVDL